VEPATGPPEVVHGISHETDRHLDDNVGAVDSLDDVSRRTTSSASSNREGFKNLTGVLTLVVWMYGTLALAEPRSGHVIILLGSLLGSDRPFQRNVVLGLDGRRARRDLHVLCRPRGARSVEPAVTPAAAVAPGAMARLALR
jgi:hypothetical protein